MEFSVTTTWNSWAVGIAWARIFGRTHIAIQILPFNFTLKIGEFTVPEPSVFQREVLEVERLREVCGDTWADIELGKIRRQHFGALS